MAGVILPQPVLVVQSFAVLPEMPVLGLAARRSDRHASRAPPPYLRFARLLI
ncbi:MAG: hypothetical protein ACYCXX_02825 [Acidiferrobacter thiooxydans]